MQRVVIIGTSGSGKTTLAARIADLKGWSHIALDTIHFLPNWIERPLDDFRTRTLGAVQASACWTLDGNYSKVRDISWGHATTLIWLNYSFPVVFWRVFIRTMQRSLSGKDVLPGCRETLGKAFFRRDSILWWTITTYQRRRREYPELFRLPEYQHLDAIELTTPRQANDLYSLGINSQAKVG
jgi:adenylate kinase family enzyme